jgi:oligopeptide/dipeptide ABC transporter ATP-binding protein
MQRGSESRIKGTNTNEDIILQVRDAAVTFGMDRGESKVLNDVNLDIRREEVLGVVGESGSGKSMLASSLLNAVVEPGQLSGTVTYHPPEGEPINLISADQKKLKRLRWEEISFIIQASQSAFNPTMTIRDHFVETLWTHDYDVDDGLEHAQELLRDLYLDPELVLQSHPHELSGGMKQRALIALSLILEPNVLVMDEPTAALDLLMQRSIIGLLYELKEKYDLTLVFVTHDLPLVADIADRIAVMYAFDIAEIGPTGELLEDAAHPYTRALLNAVPNLSTPAADISSIEGMGPDPVNVPKGCSYHPRCPLATEECRDMDPPFYDVDGEHVVACHHWKDAREEIPLGTEYGEEQ